MPAKVSFRDKVAVFRQPDQALQVVRVKIMSEEISTIEDGDTAVAVQALPEIKKKKNLQNDRKRKKQPKYHVVLWDDNDHSYGYVIMMMRSLFGHTFPMGLKVAEAVDSHGRAICMTTTKELAELKRDQIKAFGRDLTIPRCKGSMSATIEPVPGDE
jgi:ATP-dependent Clp protease adaptor protein ClpS